MNLILASQSKSRAQLLTQAGLNIDCIASHLDEDHIKQEGLSVEKTALKLAFAKATFVSAQHPGRFVIGADQMLSFGEERLDKAKDLEEVRTQLQKLRGKTHILHSAVSVVRNQEEIWSFIKSAQLTLRDFSDAFLDRYIHDQSDRLLETVGCYRLEEKGIQLFSKIEGDYFTILGLPLMDLLAFLRRENLIET